MEGLKITEELLWDYVEGHLPEKQRHNLEAALEQDTAASRKLQEIRLLSSALQGMEKEAPSMRFSAAVMKIWDQELAMKSAPLQTHTDRRIVWGIAAILLICLGVLFWMLIPAVIGETAGNGGFRIEVQFARAITDFLLNKRLLYYFIGLNCLLLLVFAERYIHYKRFVKRLA